MRGSRLTRLVLGAVLLCCLPADAQVDEDMTAKLARFIVEHARTHVVDCLQEVRDRHPDRLVLCAAYGARWSRFKSDWEFIMDHFDKPVVLEPASEWTMRGGRYERDYRVEKSDVTVVFDEAEGLLVFAYTLEGIDDLSTVQAASGRGSGSGKKIRVAGFGGVTTPRLVESSRVEPSYPEAVIDNGTEGSVALEAVVLADGTVGDLKLLYERPEGLGFGEAALTAVRHWVYEPALYRGEPVDAKLTVYVTFEPPP